MEDLDWRERKSSLSLIAPREVGMNSWNLDTDLFDWYNYYLSISCFFKYKVLPITEIENE